MPHLNVLEIGSWEGRSAIWLADNLLFAKQATVSCIDIWENTAAEPRFDRNTAKSAVHSGCKFRKIKGRSRDVLKLLSQETYDFVYVDWEHYAPTVLVELISAIQHVRCGGIIAVDDLDLKSDGPLEHYTTSLNPRAARQPTSLAAKVLLEFFQDELKVKYYGHQLIIEKLI